MPSMKKGFSKGFWITPKSFYKVFLYKLVVVTHKAFKFFQ